VFVWRLPGRPQVNRRPLGVRTNIPMSAWRRKARELFPEDGRYLDTAPSIQDWLNRLLQDLRHAGEKYSSGPNAEERSFEFARWCLKRSQNQSLKRAVLEGFVVHLGALPNARDRIPRLIGRETFRSTKRLFRQTLEPEAYEQVVAAFAAYQLAGPPPGWADA